LPKENTVVCQICKKQKRASVSIRGELVRPSIVSTIVKSHPEWSPYGYICYTDLNRFRAQYVQELLEEEKGELSSMDREVIRSLREHDLLSKDLNAEYEENISFGQRMADKVAEFGGSWTFIGFFLVLITAWMFVNVSAWLIQPYDPYPFILLNLVLSCIAALQAPIILMSQNRQAQRDRLRAQEDYRVNLKAELEIRHLSEKIDHLLNKQWERQMDILQIQMEQMEELLRKAPQEKPANGKKPVE
jgi:uncharacterized membrane protein